MVTSSTRMNYDNPRARRRSLAPVRYAHFQLEIIEFFLNFSFPKTLKKVYITTRISQLITLTRMATPLLLIAGIPASGKTHFSEWLESEKGFLYIDVDKDPSMRSADMEAEWQYCLQSKDASRFASALRQRPQPIVLEWGFPLHHISTIEALKREGFSIWWFNADHVRAKRAFTKRGTVSLRAFEIQMQAIVSNWKSIEAIFVPNIITTLDAKGKRLAVKQIYRRITERAG